MRARCSTTALRWGRHLPSHTTVLLRAWPEAFQRTLCDHWRSSCRNRFHNRHGMLWRTELEEGGGVRVPTLPRRGARREVHMALRQTRGVLNPRPPACVALDHGRSSGPTSPPRPAPPPAHQPTTTSTTTAAAAEVEDAPVRVAQEGGSASRGGVTVVAGNEGTGIGSRAAAQT